MSLFSVGVEVGSPFLLNLVQLGAVAEEPQLCEVLLDSMAQEVGEREVLALPLLDAMAQEEVLVRTALRSQPLGVEVAQ